MRNSFESWLVQLASLAAMEEDAVREQREIWYDYYDTGYTPEEAWRDTRKSY